MQSQAVTAIATIFLSHLRLPRAHHVAVQKGGVLPALMYSIDAAMSVNVT
jgi:hypothetical protein